MSLAALPDGTRRVGPLAIVRPAEGVDIATFGRADDPGVVLFDGYLFERRALRVSLELDGGATDAQIAAAAYEQWGEAVFDRLDGSTCSQSGIRERLASCLATTRWAITRRTTRRRPARCCSARTCWRLPTAVRCRGASIASPSCCPRSRSWPAPGQTFFEDVRRLAPGRLLRVARDLSIHEHAVLQPVARRRRARHDRGGGARAVRARAHRRGLALHGARSRRDHAQRRPRLGDDCCPGGRVFDRARHAAHHGGIGPQRRRRLPPGRRGADADGDHVGPRHAPHPDDGGRVDRWAERHRDVARHRAGAAGAVAHLLGRQLHGVLPPHRRHSRCACC